MLYTYKGSYPTHLPNRIRLPNGQTRTQPFSQEDILLAEYEFVENPPSVQYNQKLLWVNKQWQVVEKTIYELEADWHRIRLERDKKIQEIEWRYNRYYRHERLGITQVDTIENLDRYVQALADVTKQENPFNVSWPSL
jgi:hypothetical protein